MGEARGNGGGPVHVTHAPSLSRHILRLRAAAMAAAGDAFGVALPDTACRATQSEGRAALWLGPDEFLLLAPAEQGAAVAAALSAALIGLPHALVEVSDRQCGLLIGGPRAALALASECPLDLHVSAFPVGMCTRTVFGKAEIVLWRQAETQFHLEVWRSTTPYVRALIAEAAGEPE